MVEYYELLGLLWIPKDYYGLLGIRKDFSGVLVLQSPCNNLRERSTSRSYLEDLLENHEFVGALCWWLGQPWLEPDRRSLSSRSGYCQQSQSRTASNTATHRRCVLGEANADLRSHWLSLAATDLTRR